IRSMPLSRPISTRLTRGTGASRPSGCQTKGSAFPSASAAEDGGEAAERCDAIDSSARAIRSEVSRSEEAAGSLGAETGDFRWPALEAAREAVLLGFFDIFGLSDDAPLTGLAGACKRPKRGAWQRCNWGRGRYSPREFARTGLALRRCRFLPVSRGLSEC